MKLMVKEGMSTDVITVENSESLLNAYQLMQRRRIRHLPVVNADGVVVGILSDRDINRAMHSQIDKSNAFVKSEEVVFDPKARVEDYMSWPVKAFDKDRSLKEVAKEMIHEKISAVLVTDRENDIAGIITTEDLLRVLIELLEGPEPARAWNLDNLLQMPFRTAFA